MLDQAARGARRLTSDTFTPPNSTSASTRTPPHTSGRPRSGTATGARAFTGARTGCLTGWGSARGTGPAGTGTSRSCPWPPTAGSSDSGSR